MVEMPQQRTFESFDYLSMMAEANGLKNTVFFDEGDVRCRYESSKSSSMVEVLGDLRWVKLTYTGVKVKFQPRNRKNAFWFTCRLGRSPMRCKVEYYSDGSYGSMTAGRLERFQIEGEVEVREQ